MEYSNPPRCPFCDEPAVNTMAGNISVFRCGTEGPYEDGQYQTGRLCDMTTHLRVIEKQRQEIEQLRAENERLQSGLRSIRRECGYRSINNGTATLGGFIDMLLRNDVAAARQQAENTADGGDDE